MAQNNYLWLPLVISFFISVSTQCTYKKCVDPINYRYYFEHTMCVYADKSFGERCAEVYSSSLDDMEKNELLRRHNELRAKVAAGQEHRGLNGAQPPGIIQPLKWDNELAAIAQRWANQCHLGHDECRDINGMRIGQNVGLIGSLVYNKRKFTEIVTSWYDEVAYFDRNLIPKFQSSRSSTLHYTQLIWADTTHVGCGGIRFKNSINGYYTILLVCNYGPGGNVMGETVYSFNNKPVREFQNEIAIKVPAAEPDVQSFQNEYIPKILANEGLNSRQNYIQRFRNDQYQKQWYNEIFNELHFPYLRYNNKLKVFTAINKNTEHNSVMDYKKTIAIDDHVPQFCEYEKCKDKKVYGGYREHTMCKYSVTDLGEKCNHVHQSFLTEIEKKDILKMHNKFKIKLTDGHKGRSNTKLFQWNDKLADIAQRWANQCTYSYDECRNIRGYKVLQNVGQINSMENFTSPFSAIVNGWYRIIRHNGFRKSPFVKRIVNHVDWSHSTDVGCGGIKFQDMDGILKTYLVCNYLSSDNVNDKPIYQSIDQPFVEPINQMDQPMNVNTSERCQYHKCKDIWTNGTYNNHTMCSYLSSELAAKCNDVRQSSLTKQEENTILNIHNEFRQKFDYHIEPLKWNNELAIVAQRWANQCHVGNDKCRNLVDGVNVGQNFGMFGNKQKFFFEFSDIVNSWIMGVANRSGGKQELQSKPETDDKEFYTQLISANTTDVGCGGVKYKDSEGYYNTYLVCNYSPSGNVWVQFNYDAHKSYGAEFWFP